MGAGAGDAGRPTTDVRDGVPGALPTRGQDRGRAVPSTAGTAEAVGPGRAPVAPSPGEHRHEAPALLRLVHDRLSEA